MQIYDITLELSKDLVTWPGDPSIDISLKASIENGDICNVSSLQMGVHSGTHIDAPYHFLNDGNTTDTIALSSLIGECKVVEITGDMILKEDLLSIDLSNCKKILFKTSNSEKLNKTNIFNKDFVALDIDAANYLIEKGIELIGIDYLSIESYYSKNAVVHKTLLSNEIIILEGINLFEVPEGNYELICLPLKLQGCDGSPSRAILKTLF